MLLPAALIIPPAVLLVQLIASANTKLYVPPILTTTQLQNSTAALLPDVLTISHTLLAIPEIRTQLAHVTSDSVHTVFGALKGYEYEVRELTQGLVELKNAWETPSPDAENIRSVIKRDLSTFPSGSDNYMLIVAGNTVQQQSRIDELATAELARLRRLHALSLKSVSDIDRCDNYLVYLITAAFLPKSEQEKILEDHLRAKNTLLGFLATVFFGESNVGTNARKALEGFSQLFRYTDNARRILLDLSEKLYEMTNDLEVAITHQKGGAMVFDMMLPRDVELLTSLFQGQISDM